MWELHTLGGYVLLIIARRYKRRAREKRETKEESR